jgi:hypothetical protein
LFLPIISNVSILPLDDWHSSFALNIDTCGLSTDNVVLKDKDLVLRAHIDHNGSTLMMSERAFSDVGITFKQEDSCCKRIVGCVSFEVCLRYLNAVTLEDSDRGYLAMDFLEDATKFDYVRNLTRERGCSLSS